MRRTDLRPAPAETVVELRGDVAEAVAEMADLGHRFHLFVESSRGIDSVVHRDGPTGLRLAQLDGRAGEVAPGAVPVAADALPAPLLDLAGAVDRLELTGLPFLFRAPVRPR